MTKIKNKSLLQTNTGSLSKLFVVSCRFITSGLFMRPNSFFDIVRLDENNAELADNLIEIEFSEETASFKESPEITDIGTIYKQAIECIVAKDYIERNTIFNDLTSGPVIVFAFDQNNMSHVIGIVNIDGSSSGAEIRISSDTGIAYDNLNHRKISFTCESTFPAPHLGSNGNEYFELPNPDELI